MSYSTCAAIDIGPSKLSMKIYEVSKPRGSGSYPTPDSRWRWEQKYIHTELYPTKQRKRSVRH